MTKTDIMARTGGTAMTNIADVVAGIVAAWVTRKAKGIPIKFIGGVD